MILVGWWQGIEEGGVDNLAVATRNLIVAVGRRESHRRGWSMVVSLRWKKLSDDGVDTVSAAVVVGSERCSELRGSSWPRWRGRRMVDGGYQC
jgi:hypothetical protein